MFKAGNSAFTIPLTGAPSPFMMGPGVSQDLEESPHVPCSQWLGVGAECVLVPLSPAGI